MHCYIKDSYEQSLSVCRSGCLHSDLTNSELTIPDATQTGIWDQVLLNLEPAAGQTGTPALHHFYSVVGGRH